MKPTVSTYQVCQMILLATATRAAEAITYKSWSDEFIKKNIVELPERLSKVPEFSPVDPNDLTLEEMKQLGFRRWDADTKVMLIPLYLLPYLLDGVTVYGFSGKSFQFDPEKADNDHRGGLLSFGAIPRES